ncbi:GLPGLI family protein [Flavobacterium sp. NRK F7]|uniref:GLPGLI family protein n=1 Tax=Flavobacterium sp. NRK F7 TaxID=2954930 RepID=UPI0020918003|nr:GLPGLI family protein [Flavobacterium sp. NRK F7]MCO6161295.1 GLPGLI family protein [Flavobacterium sp. NRK F7]
MKTLTFTTLFLFFVLINWAQSLEGVVYYTSKTQLKDFNITSNDLTPEMKEDMMEKMKKAFEKTFTLHFTNFESIYEEEEKLAKPKPSSGPNIKMDFIGSSTSGKLYKNFKNRQYIKEDDIFGKEFLIVDSLQKMNWKLTEEQKKIGNYLCFKAELSIPVSEEDKKQYEEFKKKKEAGKTNLLELKEPKEEIIEAWYTLDIPISNGPGKYWGLPGLILELHEFNTVFLCNKLVLNPKDKIEIKVPKNGKKVSQNEFDSIQVKKLKSMTNENGVIEIRIN